MPFFVSMPACHVVVRQITSANKQILRDNIILYWSAGTIVNVWMHLQM